MEGRDKAEEIRNRKLVCVCVFVCVFFEEATVKAATAVNALMRCCWLARSEG